MEREEAIRLGVTASGVSPVAARLLVTAEGSWEAAGRAAVKQENMPPRLRGAFAQAEGYGRRVAAECAALSIRILERGSDAWPKALEELTDPPELLFVRGDLERVREPAVAVVGTRAGTPAGVQWTLCLTERLAEAGWAVVSGLARGIDTAAHQGALAGGGDTVAVLGCGPDVAYPSENRELQERIAREGVLLSEFPPGTEPRAHHFPRRNRILAALAAATVVVECRIRSGALVTARHALDLGRDVFVVPGWPDSPTSTGPLQLLRDGARPIRHAGDLLEDLGGIPADPRPDDREMAALDAVRQGASTPEEVAGELNVSLDEAREHLAKLELLGLSGSVEFHG